MISQKGTPFEILFIRERLHSPCIKLLKMDPLKRDALKTSKSGNYRCSYTNLLTGCKRQFFDKKENLPSRHEFGLPSQKRNFSFLPLI